MEEFKLGEYIYMGMGKCAGETVCISVAYKKDYCIKKAEKFQKLSGGLVAFTKVRKIKVGELEAEQEFNTKGE